MNLVAEDHVRDALLVLRPERRYPRLQKDHRFENDVSWVVDDLIFNGKLISDSSKRPRLSQKKEPNKPLSASRKSGQESKELRKVLRVPVPPQGLAKHCPHKHRHRTPKEDMGSVLLLATKGTLAI